jgi:hypothetical protein
MSIRLTPAAATGPLVAALGTLAAATLIAAAIMGLGLTTDPWDVPAIPRAPENASEPIVLATGSVSGGEIPGRTALQAPLRAPDLALTLGGEVPVERDAPIISLRHRERTEPAPAEESIIEYIRKRVSYVVGEVGNASANGRTRPRGRKPPLERTIAVHEIEEVDIEEGTDLVVGEPLPSNEQVDAGGAALTIVTDALEKEAQPDSLTTSGSASPLE